MGHHLIHRFNPELGIGRVAAVDGRILVVEFASATLRFAAASDALIPEDEDGRRAELSLMERLAAGDVDDTNDFLIRLDILHVLGAREADGLGSFLGGRVRLFPHQLHVAERATLQMPVRWLLADEVGLGKTIEAALIMNRLLHTQKIERCLVVAPEALTVQWLGELWRKYHQVFTLLDPPRLVDVERDFGEGFNPFDTHRRAVVALETLVERPELTAHAVSAGIDLLVVDEAQRLRRPPGHPGEPGYRAIAPIAALGRHVLLLSATPLEDDARGFFRLLQLLRPDEFPEEIDVEARLASGVPLPPCTSSTRRVDIGGLPPRVPIPVDLAIPPGQIDLAEIVRRQFVEAQKSDPLTRRRAVDRIQRALASGAALTAVLGPEELSLRQQAAAADAADPRLAWLATHAARWRRANEKTLIFTAHRETLEMVREALGRMAQLASGVFHEELSAARRDTEVARFRAEDGPSVLVSTEAGGEGRNFEFCHRLVLYDLPWKPATVEQRIGRLDRIGRRLPVNVVYFRPPSGIGADVVGVYEALGVFREPMAGREPQLAHIARALEAAALGVGHEGDGGYEQRRDEAGARQDAIIAAAMADARAARGRLHDVAYHQLHRDPYRAELGPAILARVPAELDSLIERVVTGAAARLGFRVEQVRGRRAYAIEFGNEAVIDSLPGVPAGTSLVGTFDREYAVEEEAIDFFSSGHALVEGLLAHFEDDPKGRVALVEVHLTGGSGRGIVAIYKDGPQFDVRAIDSEGHQRSDWQDAFRRGAIDARPMKPADASGYDWRALVARLAPDFGERPPYAVAAVVVQNM